MTFVYNTDEDTEHEMRIFKMMRMQRVAGTHPHLDALRHPAWPAVDGGNSMFRPSHGQFLVEGTPYDFVALDDVAAGTMAARRLLDLGHRRILVIGGREASHRMS